MNGEKHRPFNDDPPAMEFPSELSDTVYVFERYFEAVCNNIYIIINY